MVPEPTQPTPDHGVNQEISSPEDMIAPKQGASLRTTERILEALSSVPEGAQIDEYYGISHGRPKQSPEEAARGEKLIEGLKALSEGQGDISTLFGQIKEHNETSEIDPRLLRALMGNRKKAE